MKNENYLFPFEKYEIWQLSIKYSRSIYKLTSQFPKEEKFGLTNQLRRASSSIGANIAEGVTRHSEKDKSRFIEIAFGSLMETAHFLYLSKELDILTEEDFSSIRNQILELSNKTNSFYKVLNPKK